MNPLFKEKCDHWDEVSKKYYPLEECPRCNGTGFYFGSNNDFYTEEKGNLKTVTGAERLKQEIILFLIGERGSSEYNEEYGSALGALFDGFAGPPEILRAAIQQEVRDALERFARMSKDFKEPSERIGSIGRILVSQGTDPRMWIVEIEVYNEEGTAIMIPLSMT